MNDASYFVNFLDLSATKSRSLRKKVKKLIASSPSSAQHFLWISQPTYRA